MPAVTADPHPAAGLGDVERRLRSVTTAPAGLQGEGFPVRMAFAGVGGTQWMTAGAGILHIETPPAER